jgi:hypothetical protein
MVLFDNIHLGSVEHRFRYLVLASCLISTTALTQVHAAYASDIPTASFRNAPYSRVFSTGSTYVVKDRDFNADDPAIGFFSVWSVNPTNHRFQVAVRYCLPNETIATSNARLTGMTLLNNGQPLLTLNHDIDESPAQLREVRSGYYTSFYDPEFPFWADTNPFLDPMSDEFDYVPIVYVPAIDCGAGMSRFDISPLADAIAQLPDQTLQVQLQFSDGQTQEWHLGKRTVQALKELVALTQAEATSSQSTRVH